jgi:hypothetical protein
MPTSFERAAFEPLWQQLLAGGVARRPARRYLAELQDHLDDLIAEERSADGDERGAPSRALARLGSPEALAAAMIARRELRAWSRRAPVAAWLVAPPLTLVGGAALAMAGVVMTATSLRSTAAAPSDLPQWAQALASGAQVFSNAALAVLLGWALGGMAIRQRAAPLWPVLGLVVLAAVGAALQLDVTLPSAAARGEIGLAPSFGSMAQAGAFAGRLALNLVLTLTPYASLSLWRANRSSALGAR